MLELIEQNDGEGKHGLQNDPGAKLHDLGHTTGTLLYVSDCNGVIKCNLRIWKILIKILIF